MKYTTLVLQTTGVREQSKQYRDQYRSMFGEYPIIWGIGMRSIKEAELYSFFVDTQYFRFIKYNSDRRGDFSEIPLNEVRGVQLKRGDIFALLNHVSQFIRISLSYRNDTFTFYVITNNTSHFDQIEEKLPRTVKLALLGEEKRKSQESQVPANDVIGSNLKGVISETEIREEKELVTSEIRVQSENLAPELAVTSEEEVQNTPQNQSERDEKTDRSEGESDHTSDSQKRPEQDLEKHAIMLWDYDNVPLKNSGTMDPTAKSLKRIISENGEYNRMICISAVTLSDNIVSKIHGIHPDIEVIRVPQGRDSTDRSLERYATKFIEKYPNSDMLVISGDHYFIPTINRVATIGAKVIIVHTGNLSTKVIGEIPNMQLINLSLTTPKNTQKERESPNNQKNQCTICSRSFGSKTSLKQHLSSKHKTSQKTFTCHYCPSVLRTKNERIIHVQNSHSEYINELTCKKCGKLLASKQAVSSHTRSHL